MKWVDGGVVTLMIVALSLFIAAGYFAGDEVRHRPRCQQGYVEMTGGSTGRVCVQGYNLK